MELLFIMLGVFAILLVVYLIIKDFGTGNKDKVQKVNNDRKSPISNNSQPFKFVQSPDLFKENGINEPVKQINNKLMNNKPINVKPINNKHIYDKHINNKQVNAETEIKGCMVGCLGLIVMFFILMIMISSCSVGGGSNYQPGDFDFDGDSGDLDDATEFLEWKMNQEE